MTAWRIPAAAASVKKSSKKRVRAAMPSANRLMPTGEEPPSPSPASRSAGGSSPVASRVKKSIPTARTRGAANGSSITGWSARLATARAAATIVAVAPTLEARSQVSLSVRGMTHPSRRIS